MPFNMGSTQHEVSPKAHSATPTHQRESRLGLRRMRETEDISRTRVRAIVCRWHPLCDCAPGAHPQENLVLEGGVVHMAEDQAAGVPPAAETAILACSGICPSRCTFRILP